MDVTTAEITGARTPEQESTDGFASDAEIDEGYLEDFLSSVIEEDSPEAAERRELEYLVQGGSGSFFGSNQTGATGAEDRGWTKGSRNTRFFDHYHRARMWDYLWWLFQASDPTVRNIVNAYTVFIRGGGSEIKFKNKATADKWKTWTDEHHWHKKERQIVTGVSLFGEVFVTTYPKTGRTKQRVDGKIVGKRAGGMMRGEPRCRMLNSIDVEDVICTPNDPEDLVGFEQCMPPGTPNLIHAPEDVVHFSFDTLPNCVRGHPLLLTVLQDLYYYRTFRTNRHWLNMVRSRVPLTITKAKGGAREVRDLKSKYNRLPPPGTVWFLNNTTAVDFPSLNVGAADARDDAKLFLRAISQGVNLPEFIVSADASNANYSSTVTAENPAMQMFGDLQKLIAEGVRTVVSRLMMVEKSEVTVTFPSVLKNFKELVAGLKDLHAMGVVSNRTACERAGFDWEGHDGEKARIEAEGGFDPPTMVPGPGMADDDGGDDRKPGSEGPSKGDNVAGNGRATPPGMGS